MAVTLTGRLRLDRQCGASQEVSGALPALSTRDDASETHLALPMPYEWSQVGLALTRALTAGPGEPRIREITARGAKAGGKAKVALRLGLAGACAPVWLIAEPWHDPKTDQIRLREVAALPGGGGELDRQTLRSLSQRVERTAAMTLPFTATDAKRALDGLLRHTASEQLDKALRSPVGPIGPIRLSAVLDAAGTRVLVGPEALVPVIAVRGRVDIRPK